MKRTDGRRFRSGTSKARQRAAGVIIFVVLAMIAGLVVVAVQAEGRELSRATSNDGGAWVVNRADGLVGHKNRATGELSSWTRISDSPEADIYQLDDLVVVHDSSTNELIEIDPRSFADDLEPTRLPEFTTVSVVDNAVIVSRTEPLAIWRLDAAALPTMESLDGVSPLYAGEGRGVIADASDGTLAVVDADAGVFHWIYPDGTMSTQIAFDDASGVVDLTIVDASAVALIDGGNLVVFGREGIEREVDWSTVATTSPLAVLQQASTTESSDELGPAASVAGVTSDGVMVNVQLDSEVAVVSQLGSLNGRQPLAPIVHDGCTYALVTEPATFGQSCGDLVLEPLEGAGSQLRLRLVNGWVWVNDVESGRIYSVTEDQRIEVIDDWGAAAAVQDEEEPEEDEGDDSGNGSDLFVDDPDASGEVQDSDDFDPTEANVPPVAVDDFVRTRGVRAVLADALENDTDANNDILVVTEAELLTGTAAVAITPTGDDVQVTPGTGFSGTVTVRYSISDGRSDPVSAIITVDVLPEQEVNQPPVAVTDVIATAPGSSKTIDVLLNDFDPDGDALALRSIESDGGTLRWDPGGQITFTPDNNTDAGWVEMPYVVVDDRGAEAEGLLRVEIRDVGANQEPDARNDQAVTTVGRPVVINLLANDSDPDGDPLIVGSQPLLLEPLGTVVQTSTTADGEFVFRSDVPGTFLFSYTVNDAAEGGSESDTARIRVDVLPLEVNKPPVAVRDEVVIPVGETRTVYVLENDGDPDGDVVSIVDWKASGDLLVSEFVDGGGHVGFQITVGPDALEGEQSMTYSITDGLHEPVSAPVIVAVVDDTPRDQPPFAEDDVVELRVGTRADGIDVLANDFDPEGGFLRVVRVGETELGLVEIADDGQSLTVTVPQNAISSFSVPYDIEDEAGNRAAAVLRVQLIARDAPNRPPVAASDEARIRQGEVVFINVLANDSDPDGDVIALETISTQPQRGSAAITADGSVRYEPDPTFVGTDVLRYTIVDANGDGAVGDVLIGIAPRSESNVPPIANDDAYSLAGGSTATPLAVLVNDFDPDGDAIRVIDVRSPSIGVVELDQFGRVQFVPPASLDDDAVVTFEYVIADTAGNQAEATVTIELAAFDARPETTPTPEPVATVEPTPTATSEPELVEPTPDPLNEPPVAVDDLEGPVGAGELVVVDGDDHSLRLSCLILSLVYL